MWGLCRGACGHICIYTYIYIYIGALGVPNVVPHFWKPAHGKVNSGVHCSYTVMFLRAVTHEEKLLFCICSSESQYSRACQGLLVRRKVSINKACMCHNWYFSSVMFSLDGSGSMCRFDIDVNVAVSEKFLMS